MARAGTARVAPLPTLVGNDRECARQRWLALRVRPWHADDRGRPPRPAVDHLGPLTANDVEHAVERLRQQGYHAAITAALHRADRQPFLEAGFAETERLHLLLHDLESLLPTPALAGIDLRRGRRREQDEVLAVDHAAFAPFWRLDRAGLDEALTATTMVHFQVARDRAGSSATRCAGGPATAATSSAWRSRRGARGGASAPPCSPTGCAGCAAGAPTTHSSTRRRATAGRSGCTSVPGSCSSPTAWPSSSSC